MARGGPVINVTITGDSKDAQRAARDAAGEFQGFGKKVSGFAVGAGAAVTTFAISAVPKLIGVGKELVALGQNSAIGLAKAETVFGDSAADIKRWADQVNESMGLSDEAVVGLAAGMGDLLVPLGFTRKAAADMTKDTIGLSGALAAWSQGQYDAGQVSDILTKAMLGEREQLKGLGISINQAEVDQRALAIAQADGRDAITAQDKALATQQLIFEKSSDAQAAWNDGTMDAIKNQNELSAMIADGREEIGKRLLPVVQKVTKWIVDEFVPAVRAAVETFRRNWPQIRAAVEPVLEWFRTTVADVVRIVQSAWDQFGDRIMTYTRIVFDYLRNTIQNALTVIQGIVDVVLGVLSGDWSRVWEGLGKIVHGVWDQITNLIRTALRVVGLLLDVAWENLKTLTAKAWSGIVNAISAAIGNVIRFHRELPGRILTAVGNLAVLLVNAGRHLIGGLRDGAGATFDGVVMWLAGMPRRILSAIGDLALVLFDAGRKIITGLLDGMKDAWTGAKNWLGDRAKSIVNLKGPPAYDARILTGNGRLIIGGLVDGMREGWADAERYLSTLAPAAGDLVGARIAGGPPPAAGAVSNWTVLAPAGVDLVELERQHFRRTGRPL